MYSFGYMILDADMDYVEYEWKCWNVFWHMKSAIVPIMQEVC